jgi:two-component system sensor histidine kinase BarA
MKTLFLVEDNQDNADLICDLLEGEYEIKRFPDAPSVLAELADPASPAPDLFLLDISLPGMDGTTLLTQIRSIPAFSTTPAIALTAHAMKSDKGIFLRAGFNDYLSKPITDEGLLLQAITSQINGRKP